MELIEVKLQLSTNLRPTPTTDNAAVQSYPAETLAYGDEIVTITADVYKMINGRDTRIQMAGDLWLKVTRIDSVPKAGYMALRHMGTTNKYPVIIRDDRGTPPPPPPDTEPVDDKIISATLRYESGRVVELVK